MHPVQVRFSDAMWRVIKAAADEEGVSAAQYIRESVLARVTWQEAVRGGGVDWDRAVTELRRALDDQDL